MTDGQPTAVSDLQRALALVQDLESLLRFQDRHQQAALAEMERLRQVIDAAALRLEAMLAGQRASRAELQTVIQDLRSALAPDIAEDI
jgi:hypothetical protein